MGKKSKIGKNRRDKFYALAKESGYRSRASFKLMQLNQTYNFLSDAKICIDLCAAPGGWLQVAAKCMPLTSRIVGVDLYPIKPLKNIQTFCCDITEEKCKQELQRVLAHHPADVVLHDGAPNMGTSWLLDSYNQNVLALKALKLAVFFLRSDGWFITKLFRSKDYFSFVWVAQQFFRRVHTTKPGASRTESSEIFIVCEGFLNPCSVDHRFFDERFVYQEVQPDKPIKMSVNSLFPKSTCRKPRNREGYPDNVTNLFKRISAVDFVKSDNFVQMLSEAYEIEIDDERIEASEATSNEIRECLKDIKVLGKREVKNILKWRCKLRAEFHNPAQAVAETPHTENDVSLTRSDDPDDKSDVDSDREVEEMLTEANEADRRMLKRKRKKAQQLKQKQRTRLALKMVYPKDEFDIQNETVFSLKGALDLKRMLSSQERAIDQGEFASRITDPNDWFRKASMDVGAAGIIDDLEQLVIDDFDGSSDDMNSPVNPKGKTAKKRSKRDGKSDAKPVSAEELALAHCMKQSSKAKEEIIDQAYNRFTGYGDTEGLPSWFVEDEEKHCRRPVDAPQELVKEYSERIKGINARPIKKVIEARQRKQHKRMRMTERLMKKVESIPDDVEPAERQKRIEEIYGKVNKSMGKKRKRVQLVVAGKGSIPKKGRYKMVDRRMKKDKRKDSKHPKQRRRKTK